MYIFKGKLHKISLKDWLWPKIFKMRTREILTENFISVTVSCLKEIYVWSLQTLTSLQAAAKSLQSCQTLRDTIDGWPPGSPFPGILQARTPEWVVISFSNVWKWKVKVKSLSRVWLFATPWTAAYQAPPSMGFSRQEYWSGLPLTSPSLQELTANLKKLFSQFHKLCKSSLWGNTRSLLHKCDNLNFNQISISCQRIVSVI